MVRAIESDKADMRFDSVNTHPCTYDAIELGYRYHSQ